MGGFSCASRCPAFLTFRDDSPALSRQESDGYPVPAASCVGQAPRCQERLTLPPLKTGTSTRLKGENVSTLQENLALQTDNAEAFTLFPAHYCTVYGQQPLLHLRPCRHRDAATGPPTMELVCDSARTTTTRPSLLWCCAVAEPITVIADSLRTSP